MWARQPKRWRRYYHRTRVSSCEADHATQETGWLLNLSTLPPSRAVLDLSPWPLYLRKTTAFFLFYVVALSRPTHTHTCMCIHFVKISIPDIHITSHRHVLIGAKIVYLSMEDTLTTRIGRTLSIKNEPKTLDVDQIRYVRVWNDTKSGPPRFHIRLVLKRTVILW